MKFGQQLKKIRESSNLSQREIAERAGWCEDEKKGENRISNYEIGIREPKISELHDLAKALNIEVADFFPSPNTKKAASGKAMNASLLSMGPNRRELALKILAVLQE